MNELTKADPQVVPILYRPVVDVDALIAKAIDAKSAVEVLKELRSMEIDLQERRAKAAFDEAMSAFQEECPVITKDKAVPDRTGKTAYKYAPIECIEVQIRPHLRKHGFSHTFDTDTASENGWVIAKCIVRHNAGHERTSTAKFPLGTKTAIMSDTQQYASALTFANRRALSNAYGLILGGEDLDGRSGKLKPAGPSALQPDDAALRTLAAELWNLLKPVRGLERNWNQANQWLWRNELLDGAANEECPHLSEKRFREVIEKAKQNQELRWPPMADLKPIETKLK